MENISADCVLAIRGIAKFQTTGGKFITAETINFPNPPCAGKKYQFTCKISNHNIATEIKNFQEIK